MSIIPNTIQGEILRRKCRRDYSAYVETANPGFYMTHFHKYLCDKVQEFLEHPCDNGFMDILLLSVPPQHGKSYTISETLPSWFLGLRPDLSVIIAGYESTFAESFSRRNRDKFNTITQEVFLQTDTKGNYIHDCRPNDSVQSVAMWETAKGGRCRAAGLKAGITGYGADLFIMDDPIKNQEQADSEATIARIHDEMGPSVQSRIHPGGKLIVIQTRWIENDPIGWIQENWPEWIWETINLPAEYDQEQADIGPCPLGRKLGDSLMGAHLGDDESKLPQKIANTNKWLQSKKLLVMRGDGERVWNALYQGRPTAAAGNLFDPGWWKYYNRTEALRSSLEYLQLSIDATFKDSETSDFVAITLWGLKGRDVYLLSFVNKRMSFINTLACVRRYFKEYPDIDECVIEDKANGSAIIDVLQYDANVPPIVPIQPRGGKYSRAQAISPFVAAHNVNLPSDLTSDEERDIENDTANRELRGIQIFINQYKTFPFGKHDDLVDSGTQGISRIMKLITGEISVPSHKRATRYTYWTQDMWDDYDQMSELEQKQYISMVGAPMEWMDDDDNYSAVSPLAARRYNIVRGVTNG